MSWIETWICQQFTESVLAGSVWGDTELLCSSCAAGGAGLQFVNGAQTPVLRGTKKSTTSAREITFFCGSRMEQEAGAGLLICAFGIWSIILCLTKHTFLWKNNFFSQSCRVPYITETKKKHSGSFSLPWSNCQNSWWDGEMYWFFFARVSFANSNFWGVHSWPSQTNTGNPNQKEKRENVLKQKIFFHFLLWREAFNASFWQLFFARRFAWTLMRQLCGNLSLTAKNLILLSSTCKIRTLAEPLA